MKKIKVKAKKYQKREDGSFNIPCHLTVFNSEGQDVTQIEKDKNNGHNL